MGSRWKVLGGRTWPMSHQLTSTVARLNFFVFNQKGSTSFLALRSFALITDFASSSFQHLVFIVILTSSFILVFVVFISHLLSLFKLSASFYIVCSLGLITFSFATRVQMLSGLIMSAGFPCCLRSFLLVFPPCLCFYASLFCLL